MSAPLNGYLGQEPLFQKGDKVYYASTTYWRADKGLWFNLEQREGQVVRIKTAHFLGNRLDRHPYSYAVIFDGQERDLTPAAENIHLVVTDPVWEL